MAEVPKSDRRHPSVFSGRGRLRWAAVWLAFLAYPISDILSHHHSPAWTAAAWVSLVAFAALYLRTMWAALGTDPRPRHQVSPGWLAALIAATFVMVAVFGESWGGLIIYLGVATGWTLATAPALLTLAGIAVTTVVIGVTSHYSASNVAFVVFLTSALGVTMLGVRRMLRLIGELEEARDEIARLSVAEERLRFSRDLHDVLGHNLSVIALKSQVARRTMADDPQAARAALADAESVAAQSLNDVRKLVSGYRQRSLTQELSVAQELLSAAGIEPSIEAPDQLPDGEANELLAWALREGTTNVIRHSRASRCSIAVSADGSEARLSITDDGRGPGGGGGSGLQGLEERMRVLGGQVEAGSAGAGGFRLAVTVPLRP
ncbi:MAG: sensor histidine kinase [Acidimicrobiia bacterium]|nr:sensor histidine kinase [Acidimicrobiia bacterium]